MGDCCSDSVKKPWLSDENGKFFTHVKNTKAHPLQLVKEASLQSTKWSIESAPAAVAGVLETNSGNPLYIVLNTNTKTIASK